MAKWVDGTVMSVRIKMEGSHGFADRRQKFVSDKAKRLHWKFIHDPNRYQKD